MSMIQPVWLKRIAALAFGTSFLMALVLFGGIGREFVSLQISRTIFLISGGIGLLFNLLSFRHGKHDPSFNLFYWAGSVILFTGLVFIMMHWPYGLYILIGGMLVIGLSFFVPQGTIDPKKNKGDILDEDL